MLSDHGRALVVLSQDPAAGLTGVAVRLGLSEDEAFVIISELVLARLVTRASDGQRSLFSIDREQASRFQILPGLTVDELLGLIESNDHGVDPG